MFILLYRLFDNMFEEHIRDVAKMCAAERYRDPQQVAWAVAEHAYYISLYRKACTPFMQTSLNSERKFSSSKVDDKPCLHYWSLGPASYAFTVFNHGGWKQWKSCNYIRSNSDLKGFFFFLFFFFFFNKKEEKVMDATLDTACQCQQWTWVPCLRLNLLYYNQHSICFNLELSVS